MASSADEIAVDRTITKEVVNDDKTLYYLKISANYGLWMREKFYFPQEYGARDDTDKADKDDISDWEITLDTGAPDYTRTEFHLKSHWELLPKRFLRKLVYIPENSWGNIETNEKVVHSYMNEEDFIKENVLHGGSCINLPVLFNGTTVEIEFIAKRDTTAVLMGMDLLKSAKLVVNDNALVNKKPQDSYVIFSKSSMEDCESAKNAQKLLKDNKALDFLKEQIPDAKKRFLARKGLRKWLELTKARREARANGGDAANPVDGGVMRGDTHPDDAEKSV